ncbi:hypothetical protein GOV13_00725 [Candidatus Pacearchaeota archaeon]|nr:hypothetical protein [Candidatus Pacearchaeota archaeon]
MKRSKGSNIKDLETFFINEIAKIDGVKPEEVTVEYIRQQRVKRIYPNTRFKPGYGLYSFTGNEWDKIEVLADEFMALMGA